jgi:hypothetical protein
MELDKENTFGFSPLRQQSTAKLQATKQYIIENLYKGFIKLNHALFVLPILFAKKPNKGLHFCINYYKLNNMTRKDQYPLSLFKETLAKISKAKIFTKLNIR